MYDKDNRERDAAQIKGLATSKEAPVNYGRDEYVRVLRKNRLSTSVLPNHKHKDKKTPKHHGAQSYCVLCKKSEMLKRK